MIVDPFDEHYYLDSEAILWWVGSVQELADRWGWLKTARARWPRRKEQ